MIRSSTSLGKTRFRILSVAAIALSFAAAAASAEPDTSAPDDPSTPRGAMRSYLVAARAGDFAGAAERLDLRSIPPDRRPHDGPARARELKQALDRALWVDLEALSDAAEGDRDDDLPARFERVGSILLPEGPVDVMLERLRDSDGNRRWRIAGSTVAEIPRLHAALGDGPLVERLPPALRDRMFLELRPWQWLALPLAAGLAVGVALVAVGVALRLLRGLLRRARPDLDVALLDHARSPLRLIFAVLAFASARAPIAVSVPAERMLGLAESALLIVAVTWLLLRGVDATAEWADARMRVEARLGATTVLQLARRVAKVALVALAGILVLQNAGVAVGGALAGLGVGGLAVALGAQKTLENLFGGLTLAGDQPMRVGDFVRFGERLGTVEEIGLRSTRLRTLDRTVVSIPNAELASIPIENFARRDRVWLHARLGLRYETSPDQLRHVLVSLKRLLLSHPRVDPDPARVRFVGLGGCSLDLEIFAYVTTRDFDEFLAIREDLLLRTMDVVAASGTAFAFPSQTVYAAPDPGLDGARAARAAAEVAAWRAQGELALPNPSPSEAAALRARLDWPPRGSPSAG